ncbi:hypothetical protein SLE2022_248680 [Rubroshorea leprosula]
MDCNNGREPWSWHGENYCLQKDTNYEMSDGLFNEVALNEEDLSYMFDETTPVKACGDLAYHVTRGGSISKQSMEQRETYSQVKRRRMLQFDNDVVDSPSGNGEMSSAFLKSNETVDSLEEVEQWVAGFSESAPGCEGLDQSSEQWLADCFNDLEMQLSPDDMNFTGASDIQLDGTEFCNAPPEVDANVMQQNITRTSRNIVFKGRKSYIRPPAKLASSVAYPFAFIKPCSFHGDVTLKDINQRIQTPPPSKSKQNKEEPAVIYPTSAFSGKPVVGKTKIRTEGGKGSITIMRTKGPTSIELMLQFFPGLIGIHKSHQGVYVSK